MILATKSGKGQRGFSLMGEVVLLYTVDISGGVHGPGKLKIEGFGVAQASGKQLRATALAAESSKVGGSWFH